MNFLSRDEYFIVILCIFFLRVFRKLFDSCVVDNFFCLGWGLDSVLFFIFDFDDGFFLL